MFPRASDPALFQARVSQWSVAIPADAASDPRLPGLSLPLELAGAAARRKVEFLAGRLCAREAIGRLTGTTAAVLARDVDGSPVWPPGLVGSISHTAAYATAAVARRTESSGLGIDVEPVMTAAAAAEVESLVASDDELRVALTAGLDPLAALTLLFSAKESLYKALYPARRQRFDYRDCALVAVDAAARRFSIRLAAPFGDPSGAPHDGRYELADGAVRTGVLLA